jgi:hypothetical protein
MADVVQNQNINYALYYNVLDYFKLIMKNHPSINHVSQGDASEFDQNPFPAYPVGNVMISQSELTEKTITHTIELIIADKIKEKGNESSPTTNEDIEPYYGTDDSVDILANTLAIINDLTTFTQFGVEAFSIDGNIIVTPFKDRFNNGLAGHVASFRLVSFANRNRCTFNLLSEEDLDVSC